MVQEAMKRILKNRPRTKSTSNVIKS